MPENMPHIRTIRRIYYNLFAHFYDAFINLHARHDASDTRRFLVDMAKLETKSRPFILDICCGTGDVIVAFASYYADSVTTGYDFSREMLKKVRKKQAEKQINLIEGDASTLPFIDESFDVITCSHALYELKSAARKAALFEIKRVIRQDGVVLLMEHEVPTHPFIKILFNIRMLAMGSANATEFVKRGTDPFQAIFSDVTLYHSPTGKSKLIVCRK